MKSNCSRRNWIGVNQCYLISGQGCKSSICRVNQNTNIPEQLWDRLTILCVTFWWPCLQYQKHINLVDSLDHFSGEQDLDMDQTCQNTEQSYKTMPMLIRMWTHTTNSYFKWFAICCGEFFPWSYHTQLILVNLNGSVTPQIWETPVSMHRNKSSRFLQGILLTQHIKICTLKCRSNLGCADQPHMHGLYQCFESVVNIFVMAS